MNYTQNIQLPQWVESDRIMMRDFNEAMVRVDEALTALERSLPAVKLREFVVPGAVARWTLDLSGIDAGQYAGLRLAAKGPGHVNGRIGLQLNGLAADYEYCTSSSLNPAKLTMIPFGNYGSFFTTVELRPAGDWTLFSCDGVSESYNRIDAMWYRGLHRKLAYPAISAAEVLCEEAESKLDPGTTITLYGLLY